jgi:hypothetical protein
MASTVTKVAPFGFVLLLFIYIFCVSGMHLYGGCFVIPKHLDDGSLNPEFDCTTSAGNFYISPASASTSTSGANSNASSGSGWGANATIEHCPTRVNYDNFFWSFVTTFQVLTGNDA